MRVLEQPAKATIQPSSGVETVNLSEQLKMLADFHATEQLTDEEYNAAKRKVIEHF